MTAPQTLPSLLADAVRRDGARPLLTWLGPDGARTELSARTYENNVAKAAGLLQDELDAEAGSRVALHLPPHWQTSIWLGACAAVGCEAQLDGDDDHPDVVAALVVDPVAATDAPVTLAVPLHPLGLPSPGPLPPGVDDAAVAVRAHGDVFTAYDPPSPGSAWLVHDGGVVTQEDAVRLARATADRLGLAAGGRLLVAATAPRVGVELALAVVALPLACSVSVVLATDPLLAGEALDAAAAREHCDATVVAR